MTKEHAEKCKSVKSNQECDCDGYHTFDELYNHRITLYLAVCRMLADKMFVWRSKIHSDGTKWDDWFVLGIKEKDGEQITYHLPMGNWDECDFAETLEKAPEFDGHTSDDVLERIREL